MPPRRHRGVHASQPEASQSAASQPETSQSETSQPDALHIECSHARGSSRSKRHRGYTMATDIWIRMTGPPMHVNYDAYGRPVCGEAKKLITFLGTLARKSHIFPINVRKFTQHSQENKDTAWHEIQERFTTDHPRAKNFIFQSLAKKWTDFKAELKKAYFDPNDRVASIRNLTDERVDPTQWAMLVGFWMSSASKEISNKNKANRAKQIIGHTGGTKSFARMMHEMAVANDGIEPDRADVWIATHTRRDQTPLEPAGPLIESIKRIQAEPSTSGSSTQSTGRNDTLAQVLGRDRHGRLRGMGLGATATNTWGPTQMITVSKERVKSLESELEQNRAELEQSRVELRQNRTEMHNMREEFNTMREYMTMFADRFGVNVPSPSFNSQDSDARG